MNSKKDRIDDRSEMLKLIAEFIRTEFKPRSEQGWDLSLPYAVSLLDLIEDAGMRPPRDAVLLRDKWKTE